MTIHPALVRRRSGNFLSAYTANGKRAKLLGDFAEGRLSLNGAPVDTIDQIADYSGGLGTMVDSDGVLKWNAHNLAINSDTPATQNITVVSGADYTVECTGSGSITLSGAGTGSVTEGNPVEVTASTTTLTLTIVGAVDHMWAYRSDLGGMVAVPTAERGLASSATYLPTKADPIPAAPELVTNGTFDTDVTGWTVGATSLFTWNASGYADLDRNSGSGYEVYQDVTTVIGKAYVLTIEVISFSNGAGVFIDADEHKTDSTTGGSNEVITATFTATSTTTRIYLGATNSTTATATFDNVSFKELRYDPSSPRYLPRVGHHKWDGSAWVNKGLRHESEARTNILIHSQDFTNAAWSKENTGALAVDATGPDGETSAVTLVDSGATGTGAVWVVENFGGLSAIPYTFSVFLKEDQLSWASLDIVSFGIAAGNPSIKFDLGSGALGTGASGVEHRIEDYGDGWYRCSVTFTSVNATGSVRIRLANSDSDLTLDLDGTSSILIYGAQFEAGDTPSTYIPTTGATATRAAETFDTPAGTAPWSASGVSIAMKGEADGDTLTLMRWQADADNNILQAINTTDFTFTQEAATVVDSVTGGSYTSGTDKPFSIASYHTPSAINGAVDGTALTANTTPVSLPDLSPTDIQWGYDFMGTIEEIAVWDETIADAGVAEATS